MSLVNRQWVLASRPQGRASPDNFEFREVPFQEPELKDGQILVRNRVFSCAPTMRNWMNDSQRSYRASIGIGEPIIGVAGAEVVASRHAGYPVGSLVTSVTRWEDLTLLHPDTAAVPVYPVPSGITLADAMGPFSLNSMTAYFGLFRVGRPKPGETVVVSGAAGSVGSVACQLAKHHGCTVIGIAGGKPKCDWLVGACGVDHAIDYKSENVGTRLGALCPKGVDVFFDNVGGEILHAVMDNIAVNGRVAVCGQVSAYDSDTPAPGPRDMMKVVYWRVRIEGFVLGDFAGQIDVARADIDRWLKEGGLVFRQDIRHGFKKLPAAFLDLFTGSNEGALLVTADADGAGL
jgi:NADPH-dependent curcumin reductase CurA